MPRPGRPRLDRPCLVRSLQGSPFDLGRLQAELTLTRDTPRNRGLIQAWREIQDGLTRGDAAARARAAEGEAILKTLSRIDPALVHEHEGLAAGLGLGAEPPVIASLWARRTPIPERAGCTLFAVTDRHSGRTLVGRNFDLRVEDIDRRLIIFRPDDGSAGHGSAEHGPAGRGHSASVGGCGGLVGRLDGVNGRGLAAAAAEVFVEDPQAFWEPDGPPAGALDCSLVLRVILDRCATTEEAVELARGIPQWTAFNFLIADRSGSAAVVEYAGPRTQVRRMEGGLAIAATNHYLAPSLAGCSNDGSLTFQRYSRVLEAVRSLPSDDPAACQRILAAPGIHQRHITLWSSVLDPGEAVIHLAPGRPDLNDYRRFEVGGRAEYDEEIAVNV